MKLVYSLIMATVALCVLSCGSSTKRDPSEYFKVNVACDETFRPIIEEEMRAFHCKYTDAVLDTTFTSETECINMMLSDSFKVIITTRPLSEKEKDYIKQKHKLLVENQPIAYDAIALICNNSNPDSMISVGTVRRIVSGEITRWEDIPGAKNKGKIEVIFDDNNSSTVRFVQDSILEGKELKGNLKTAKSNQNVISYVNQSPNAIGILGVDWIRNPKDSTNLSFDQRVRVMRVSNSAVPEKSNSFQPVQYYIATKDYPYVRKLWVSLTEPYMQSYNRNFYFWLTDTEGQLIITKGSQLLPIVPVQVKQVDVK